MRTPWVVGSLAAAAIALAGCGSEASTGPVTSASPSAPAAPTTSLTITASASADAQSETWTLTCDPPGGTHPDPAAACPALAAATAPFAPIDRNQVCTEIYGGPQTATVTGTVAGEPVNASFSRINGCEIARWDAISAVLVLQGGA